MDGITATQNLVSLHKELVNELNQITNQYLDKYISEDLHLDIKGWERDQKVIILLSHAAFENYIEMISIIILEYGFYEFIYNKKTTEIILCFVWTKVKNTIIVPNDEWEGTNRELLRKDISDAKETFKKDIFESNHGIKIKNLNNMLRPVSLNLPQSSILLSSLDDLTNYRGKFAHRFLEKGLSFSKIKYTDGPEAIKRMVLNSYRLMYRLHIRALSKIECTEAFDVIKNEYCRLTLIKHELDETSDTENLFSL